MSKRVGERGAALSTRGDVVNSAFPLEEEGGKKSTNMRGGTGAMRSPHVPSGPTSHRGLDSIGSLASILQERVRS